MLEPTPYESWKAASAENRVRAVIAQAMGHAPGSSGCHGNSWLLPDYFSDPSASAALLDWLDSRGLAVMFAQDRRGYWCEIWKDLIEDALPAFEVSVAGGNSAALRRALALAAAKAIEAGAIKP